jgi:hypothetical protein
VLYAASISLFFVIKQELRAREMTCFPLQELGWVGTLRDPAVPVLQPLHLQAHRQRTRGEGNQVHCNENPIYVFLFWESRGLSPNLHIHVFVSDLNIPRIGPHISCSRIGRSIVGIYKPLTDTCIWTLGLWPRNSFSGNICFQFSVLVLCSVLRSEQNTKIRKVYDQRCSWQE